MADFIDTDRIEDLLRRAEAAGPDEAAKALDRAERGEPVSLRDVAVLLTAREAGITERIHALAGEIKRRIYGNRVVMFAPLYLSDHCVNACAYCSFNAAHRFPRRRLTQDELRGEVRALERMGHKRLALEAGEHDGECPVDYVLECIGTVYAMKCGNGEIRRVNVNIAPTTVENYRRLKAAGIGTYILFQETYHEPTYRRVHPAGPKSDFVRQVTAFDRAMEAGIDDVGGGVLFGLADPRFEVLALMLHNEHLERNYGAGFHTVSVPRLCPAPGADPGVLARPVDDETFARIVAVIRIALPHTGMILSTRENREMRRRLLTIGISQLSAGSSTEVGGYTRRPGGTARPQFEVSDERGAAAVIAELLDDGRIPSFCTACYRSGRTGDRFMALAKSGAMADVCLPNALMTLCEFAADYGDDDFRWKVAAVTERELAGIPDENVRRRTAENVGKIRSGGVRDLFL